MFQLKNPDELSDACSSGSLSNNRHTRNSLYFKLAIVVLCCLIGALLVEFLTLFGSPFTSALNLEGWSKRRIVITWLALIALSACVHSVSSDSANRAKKPKGRFKKIGFAFALSLCLFLALMGMGVLTNLVITVGTQALVSLVAFSILCVIFLRDDLAESPESVYLPVGIAFSVIFCFMAPIDTGVSWDDQVHYDRAVAVSYLLSPEYTEADEAMLYPEGVTEFGFLTDGYSAYLHSLEVKSGIEYEKCAGAASAFGFNTISYQALGYLPAALGLWIARLLHLPFAISFCFGRLFNALFFMALVYCGIRRLKVGKAAIILFSLLPTVVFLSSSYSYDPWCIGWLLYGFLRYISWHQRPSFKMTWKEMGIVSVSFALGCGPKAIYFPIFLVLLFVPNSFFGSKKQMHLYRMAAVGGATAVSASFLAPLLFNGAGTGDSRGGGDVDSTGQIRWILDNPSTFTYVIAAFLKDYLSPAASGAYTDFIAYLSQPSLNAFPLAALLIFFVVDNGKPTFSYAGFRYKIAAVLLMVGTSTLIAAALYVSFTPVGHNTVNGCQGRYLLPLIVPTLMLGLNMRSTYEGSRAALNGAALCAAISFNAWACFSSVVAAF